MVAYYSDAQMATGRQHGINREGLLELLQELPESTTPAYAAAQAQLLTATNLPLPLTAPLLLFVTTPRSFDMYYQRTQNYVTGKVRYATLQRVSFVDAFVSPHLLCADCRRRKAQASARLSSRRCSSCRWTSCCTVSRVERRLWQLHYCQ